MAKHMKLWVVGALLLAVAGTVMASNMGFKFVPNIAQGNKVYTISLPINNNYTNAESVFADVNASGCAAAKIEKIVPSAGGATRVTWLGIGNGSGGADNFTVAKGEGYIVQTNGTCTGWVVVGSHDPTYSYSFSQANKVYLASIPYHTTATVAQDLFASIPSCAKVERIVPSAGGATRVTWLGIGNGSGGADNFGVTIGEAYIVQVSAASTWTPAHY